MEDFDRMADGTDRIEENGGPAGTDGTAGADGSAGIGGSSETGGDKADGLVRNKRDKAAYEECLSSWDKVMKPLGSMGRFEELIASLAGIYGRSDFDIGRRCVLVMCADNGVVARGVSQSDSSVTKVVAEQIALGRSNINAMAKVAGADVYAVDMGMAEKTALPSIMDLSVTAGTADIAAGPAMSFDECMEAINNGRNLVKSLRFVGYELFVTGEMGIGNTTTASAIASVLLGRAPAEVTGRGAGLDDERLVHKIEVIEAAIAVNRPDKNNPFDILTKLGGFDIAGIVGVYLGGMENRAPVVIDGFISLIAAALARMIEPSCADFMIPSHISAEPAAAMLFDRLGMKPVIDAGMRLGEGTGGVCLLPLLDIALAEYKNAHRFGDTEVQQYERL